METTDTELFNLYVEKLANQVGEHQKVIILKDAQLEYQAKQMGLMAEEAKKSLETLKNENEELKKRVGKSENEANEFRTEVLNLREENKKLHKTLEDLKPKRKTKSST